MQLFKAEKKPIIAYYFAGLAFVLLNSYLLYKEIFYLPVLPVMIILLALVFTSLDRTLLLIVFFVPISIPLSNFIGKDAGIDLYIPTEPLLAGILLLIFLKYLLGNRMDYRLIRHPVTLAIFFNIAWILLTSITSTMPVVSFKFLLARIWFITTFYLLAAEVFRNPVRIRQYVWAYLIPFIFVIFYVLIKHMGYGLNDQQASHWVVKPFFSDHTSYGAVLALLIPAITGVFYSYRGLGIQKKTIIISVIALLFIATLFSYTRAAWVSLILIAGILIVILLKVNVKLLIMATLLVAAVLISSWSRIMMRLEQNTQDSSGEFTEHVQSISNVRTDASNLERINRWNSALRMWEERPIFGWGPGTYMFQYAPFQVSHEKTIISTNTGNRGNAHSEYLGPLSESGVIGMLSILFIVFATVSTGLRVYYNASSKQVKVLALGLLLGLITYWIHGILNNFLDTDKASALVWGFTAALVAMDIFHREIPDELSIG